MADPDYAGAISSIESGGNYGILGPLTKGDRAYGKYQIMGANVPVWTKEILGAPMSPEEFLANPQAQDAVFQGKFGQYVQKFGPEGAAQAWFAGPGGVGKLDRKDALGTSVGSYGQKFMANLGSPTEPISGPSPNQNLTLPAFNQPQVAPPANPSLPAYAAQPQQTAAQMPMAAPPLNAPAIQQALRQFNMARAFSKIPTAAGFQGFKLG